MLKYKKMFEFLSEGQWSFITIRFHETDMVLFDHIYNSILVPFFKKNEYYITGIENPGTTERHCHCVIKNTTCRKKYGNVYKFENNKVQDKINTIITSKKNILYNTLPQNALDCANLPELTDKEHSIGYIRKQLNTDIQTNIPEEAIDYCRQSYILQSKKIVCPVDNPIEYKNLSKGNMLLYLYDAHVKFPDINLNSLPSYMVKYMNVSFISCKSLLNYALLELKIKISSDKKVIDKINLCREEDFTDCENLPYSSNYDNIKYLQEQIEIEKFNNSRNLLKIEKLQLQNEKYQDEILSLKNKINSQKNLK